MDVRPAMMYGSNDNKTGGRADGGRAEDVKIFVTKVDRIRNEYARGTVHFQQFGDNSLVIINLCLFTPNWSLQMAAPP